MAVSAPAVTPSAGTPATEPGPDLQALSSSFAQVLSQGDGEYSVAVSMHPPQLGEVRALLSLQGNVLQVVLTPHQDLGRAALASALPALRNQLSSSGLQVEISFGQRQSDSGENRGPADRAATTGDREGDEQVAPPDDEPVDPMTGNSDSRIHLVL